MFYGTSDYILILISSVPCISFQLDRVNVNPIQIRQITFMPVFHSLPVVSTTFFGFSDSRIKYLWLFTIFTSRRLESVCRRNFLFCIKDKEHDQSLCNVGTLRSKSKLPSSDSRLAQLFSGKVFLNEPEARREKNKVSSVLSPGSYTRTSENSFFGWPPKIGVGFPSLLHLFFENVTGSRNICRKCKIFRDAACFAFSRP